MGDYTLEIGGRTITQLFDVPHEVTSENQLGSIEVVVANTDDNRGIRAGTEATLTRGSTELFSGVVANKPTETDDDLELPITLTDKRQDLKGRVVQRVYVNEDTGDVVTKMIEEQANPRDRVYLFTGDEPNEWTDSGFDNFESGSFGTVSLNDAGDDVLYFDFETGFNSEATLTRDAAETIPSKMFYQLDVRSLINNSGDLLEVEVEVTDDDGLGYTWQLPLSAAEIDNNTLPVQEAEVGSSSLQANQIQFRFTSKGRLPERRAGVFDFARIRPFTIENRDTTVGTGEIDSTGNTITRRLDGNILSKINDLAAEDGATVYIDTDDNLHYEVDTASGVSDLTIEWGVDPIVDHDIQKPYDEVVNRVVVQGADDINVVVEDSASIQYYGAAARDEPIIDESLQTREEARERGEGELEPWVDVEASFTLGDDRYEKELSIGELINVSYPPADLNDEYEVTEIAADEDGFPVVTVEGFEGEG